MADKEYYDQLYDELYHHGILGQKWGVRRFQNEDGSLTEEGRRRYGHLGSQEEIDAAIKRDKVRFKQERDAAKTIGYVMENAKKRIERLDKKIHKAIEDGDMEKVRKLWEKQEKEREVYALGKAHLDDALDRIGEEDIDELKKSRRVQAGKDFMKAMVFGGAIGGSVDAMAEVSESMKNFGNPYVHQGKIDLSRYLSKHEIPTADDAWDKEYDSLSDKLYSDKDFLKSLYKKTKAENPEFFKGMTFKDYLDTDFFDNDFYDVVSDMVNETPKEELMYKWSKVKSENSGNTSS